MLFERLQLSSSLSLRALKVSDARDLFALTERNLSYLRQWLPWLDFVQRCQDSEAFIQKQNESAEKGTAFSAGIFLNGNLCGVVSFNEILSATKEGMMGYWIDQNHQGQGLATQSVRALANSAFEKDLIQTAIIRVGTENLKSQAIPRRLGFEKVGTKKAAENLYGRWVDHDEYRRSTLLPLLC